MQILVTILGLIVTALSLLFYTTLRWPAPMRFILKIYVAALSPSLALVGLAIVILGLMTGSNLFYVLGIYNLGLYLFHYYRVTQPPEKWNQFIYRLQKKAKPSVPLIDFTYFITGRRSLLLPRVPQSDRSQDLVYATVPGTNRQLLCDIWQPREDIKRSGTALIYLHGSAWYLLDKDLGTRPFFSHLAAQGHVVMDVAYRLAPETDMMGMIHDTKRAIAWLRDNADRYEFNPENIMISGGSAGGHLALMAAYTENDQAFIPEELAGKDISVNGVISLYGPTDLIKMYYHTNQHLTTRINAGGEEKSAPKKMASWTKKLMGENYKRLGLDKELQNAGAFAPLLGGHPDEIPETYMYYSPISYVDKHCPPTLLIHGAQDLMVPVESSIELYNQLQQQHITAMLHIIPQTDHAFDLILPKISPSAHNAIYDIERFLNSMANKKIERNSKHQLTI